VEEAEKDFQKQKEERERKDQEKLDKNRAKREKAKQRQQKKKVGGSADPEEGAAKKDGTSAIKKKLAPAKLPNHGNGDADTEINGAVEEEAGIVIHDDD
jgi:predicted phage gp36 major capsid-like protein